MKNYLLAFIIIGIGSVSLSQTPVPLPPESAELVAKYKRWMEAEQMLLDTKAKEKRRAVITALLAQQKAATSKGNLKGALAIEEEVKVLKKQSQREDLLGQVAGEWEWNTGAKMEFGPAGKAQDGQVALWVINPEKRLLYYRAGDDWHYDIVLSGDGNSFTARRIQSGKEYSAKRISK